MSDNVYGDRVAEHQRSLTDYDATITRCESTVRILLLAGAAGIAGVWLIPESRWVVGSIGIMCLFAAAAVSLVQQHCVSKRLTARRMLKVNQQGVARLTGDWDGLPSPQVDVGLASNPVATDLDLFGHCSLLSLMCTAETQSGINTLAGSMLEFAKHDEIAARQIAVAELADQLDWRQQLQLKCANLATGASQLERLIDWSQDSRHQIPPVVTLAARILPVALVACIGLWSFRATAIVGLVGLAIVLLTNILLTVLYSGKVHSLLHDVSPTAEGVGTDLFSEPFRHIRDRTVQASALKQIGESAETAASSLQQLERRLLLGNLARNPFTVGLVYFPLQILMLWDFHVESTLRRWKDTSGGHVEDWFDSLGKLEVLASLAALKFDHPDWCFATIEDQTTTLSATAMGHPILIDDERVGNDVELGPTDRVMMITGSNMSGKSTLLRAIGTNAILAGMGGPACCAKLTLPRLKVLTCMRVGDSIERGQSLFMAELLRLKAIVEAVDKSNADDPLPLYLLDEILHGTNTAERRIAVESVVGHLLQSRAIGAISTHDLELARDSTLNQSFQLVHLRETFTKDNGQPNLTFDYQLRTGLATTTNALKLVQMIGLPTPTE